MTKTEIKAILKWLNYMEYNLQKDLIRLQEEYIDKPCGSNRMYRRQLWNLFDFINYQRAVINGEVDSQEDSKDQND